MTLKACHNREPRWILPTSGPLFELLEVLAEGPLIDVRLCLRLKAHSSNPNEHLTITEVQLRYQLLFTRESA